MKAAQGFMPTTNKSVLVKNQYKGFPLQQGKDYRPTNIDKASSLLALAMEKQQKLYVFEIYEDELHTHFSNQLNQFDPQARYLRVGLNAYVELAIFTHKSEEDVVQFLEKRYEDFAVKVKIDNVADSAMEAASVVYSLAEHFLIPKFAKKDRQMTGSDLTPEQKLMSVEFELKPNIVRHS